MPRSLPRPLRRTLPTNKSSSDTMNILAIETSCDETSVAIVRDGRHIAANVIASQIALHQKYGGVVPELASRQHIVTIIPVLEEALTRTGMTWVNIDAV